MNNTSNSSITALVPGGVVTTQNISTVIKPKGNNNSMQFVKIQTPDLTKKAEEQIRVVQESNISKEKIKEVEEEWQNNLLNWKSKRRQQFVGQHDPQQRNDEQNADQGDNANGRKIKTFAEMIEQRAKTGNKLNFNLERYIGSGDDDETDNVVAGAGIEGIDANDRLMVDAVMKDRIDMNENTSSKNNNNNNSHHQLSSRLQHQLDSDCEAHSSLSSGYNQTNSKSPSSSLDSATADAVHQQRQHRLMDNIDSVKSAEKNVKNCDNSESIFPDSHSISVVASSTETDQLNSTLKQGITKPPTPPVLNRSGNFKPILDVDTRTNEVSTKLSDEDNSAFEDDDDEEEEDDEHEEQKQLQRIAFVQKLKAFERLTKPTMQEPKFVPTRTVKAPPPPPLPSRTKQQLDVAKKIPNLNQEKVASVQPMMRDDKITGMKSSPVGSPNTSSSANSSIDLKGEDLMSREAAKKPQELAPKLQPVAHSQPPPPQPIERIGDPIKQVNPIPAPLPPPSIQQPMQTHTRLAQQPPEQPHQSDFPDLVPRMSNVRLAQPEPTKSYPNPLAPAALSTNANVIGLTRCESAASGASSQPDTWQEPLPPPLLNNNNISPQQFVDTETQNCVAHQKPYASPAAQRPLAAPSNPLISQQASQLHAGFASPGNQNPSSRNHRSGSASSHTQAMLPEPPAVKVNNNQPLNQTNKISHHHQQQQHQQQPPTPQRSKPASRETDKDRTVLSVSGKKRCSSCKEELGRGAAAFVVESLSLVYHTNCFRCSVCHVNLSNGFRGVDVRVHAGALHCQNCYSKDGLNYSRV